MISSFIIRRPNCGEKITLPALPESADVALMTRLAKNAQAPVLVLTANAQTALRLEEEWSSFAPHAKIARLVDWETLPYDHFSPHADLVSERLACLWKMQQNQVDVIICAINTALQKCPPPSHFHGKVFLLELGARLNLENFRSQLIDAGYQHVTQVYGAGEFSIRGNLLDLYPSGGQNAFRLEFFDDEIEAIRLLDIDSQRSGDNMSHISILPAKEFPTHNEAMTLFRTQWRETFEGDASKIRIYKEVSAGRLPAGIEYWWPLFVHETADIFDYLPPKTHIILHQQVLAHAEPFWQELRERYRFLGQDPARPCLPPSRLYLSIEDLAQKLHHYPVWRLGNLAQGEPLPDNLAPLPDLSIDRRANNPTEKLAKFIAEHQDFEIFLLAASKGRRETLNAMLREFKLVPQIIDAFPEQKLSAGKNHFFLMHGALYYSFIDLAAKRVFISENSLYQTHPQSHKKRRKTQLADTVLRDLAEIKIGDLIVHENHGIGRYLGLVSMDVGDGEQELMMIEYAEGAKLYLPVAHLQFISRFAGAAADTVSLSALGSKQWDKARQKAAEEIRDTAAELLHLYAMRAAKVGFAFPFPEREYAQFAAGFGFEETPDQAAAIEAVIEDMRAAKPMDRLVCGDVGFGKTEVALRAAFLAVMAGKQVALLVPTTLLAEQHYQNFTERFALFAENANFPAVKIAELSRFRSGKELKNALAGLADGSVDIVIGTHRLLQPDVQFARLGLTIIDEEHRFGVRQKEQLKALRKDSDILTLTATPIPRTLAMSLEGLRDFSIIATAPNRRLAVKTFVHHDQDGIIREAILRELRRGGQVFFLYNDVQSIEHMQMRLQNLVPEASIAVAHGQMRERELEAVMRQFQQQRFHILLCSTIIETGIDMPNANTILIHRADKFGLAQLHQLRGRVGRSHHQAYAYLLTPEQLSSDAKKRLEAIQSMDELGAGFMLAMHDLEIRGAGEVLGDQQSGEMKHIGFGLYTEMLNKAIKALQDGREATLDTMFAAHTEIELGGVARLPEDYCPDVHERLVLYKRLASAADENALRELEEELIDRFGMLPEAAQLLLETHKIRLMAQPLHLKKCVLTDASIVLLFHPNPPIDPMWVVHLVQNKRNYHFAGDNKLRVDLGASLQKNLAILRLKDLLRELATPNFPQAKTRQKSNSSK